MPMVAPARRLRRVGRTAAWFAAGWSLLTLTGWVTGVVALRSVLPALPPMMPITAVVVAVAAISVLLGSGRRSRRSLALGVGALATAAGVVGLVVHLLGPALEPALPVSHPLITAVIDGTPALASCWAMVALGLAFMCRHLGGRMEAVADALAAIALVIPLAAMNAYAHGAVDIFVIGDTDGHLGMSLPASVGLFGVTTAFLLVRTDRGVGALLIRRDDAGTIARRFLPAVVVVPPLLGALVHWLSTARVVTPAVELPMLAALGSALAFFMIVRTAEVLAKAGAAMRAALTREREARAEAEHHRRRLSTVVENAPSAILFCDHERRVLVSNQLVEQLLGVEPARAPEVLRTLRGADGKGLPPEQCVLTRALAGQRVVGEARVAALPGGKTVAVTVNAAPTHDPLGMVNGAVVVVDDDSSRRELERLRADYVGLVAHDLRAPLNSLRLQAALIKRYLSTGRLQEATDLVAGVNNSVLRMDALVGDLHEVTRLESGLRLELRELDVEALVRDELAQTMPEPERARCRIEVRGGPLLAPADPLRLARVVGNLLSNASKYAPGDSALELALRRAGDRIELSIRDHGPGLSAADAAHVFDKYYRVASSAHKAEGLGLGLYICRLIVEAHGGRIWVSSQPGDGATFTVSLPASPPQLVTRETSPPAAA